MYKLPIVVSILTSVTASIGWADDVYVDHSSTDPTYTTDDAAGIASTASSSETTRGYLRNEVVGIKPQVGVITFTDQLGSTSSRGVAGFSVEANMASSVNRGWSNVFLGPSTGVIYSHLGDPTSNFVGANPSSTTGSAGSNLLLIPANLKLGYAFNDFFRLSAHGGGNVVYRSLGTSIALGDSSVLPTSVWRIFPNVGADAEFALGKNVTLLIRPDWTLSPGADFFTGTIGLGIPMG